MKGFVCITGVSSGIGLAAAIHLSDNGYSVIGSVRTDEDGKIVRKKVGDKFQYFLLDLSDRSSIDDFSKKVENACGRHGLKALVNNSGIAIGGPLMYIDDEDLRDQFDVNVFGMVAITKYLFPLLKKCPQSRIVNISSVSGIIAHPFLGPYAASKFALEALSDAMRKELMPYGIKVIVIQSGPIQSQIWQKGLRLIDKYEDTPYAGHLKKVSASIKKSDLNAMPSEVMSRTILKAIENKRVRSRYLLHKGKVGIWLMRHILPDGWIDKLTYKYLFNKEKLE
jgi:short-subunit dehydrogenase